MEKKLSEEEQIALAIRESLKQNNGTVAYPIEIEEEDSSVVVVNQDQQKKRKTYNISSGGGSNFNRSNVFGKRNTYFIKLSGDTAIQWSLCLSDPSTFTKAEFRILQKIVKDEILPQYTVKRSTGEVRSLVAEDEINKVMGYRPQLFDFAEAKIKRFNYYFVPQVYRSVLVRKKPTQLRTAQRRVFESHKIEIDLTQDNGKDETVYEGTETGMNRIGMYFKSHVLPHVLVIEIKDEFKQKEQLLTSKDKSKDKDKIEEDQSEVAPSEEEQEEQEAEESETETEPEQELIKPTKKKTTTTNIKQSTTTPTTSKTSPSSTSTTTSDKNKNLLSYFPQDDKKNTKKRTSDEL